MAFLKSDCKKAQVFLKFHNSVEGHLWCDQTYKALKLSEHNWVEMKEELKKYISEWTISQKIKWQRPENWKDMVEHHLYGVAPWSELSIDNNFSKFVGLYPATTTSTLDFVKAFLSWVGILGCRRLSEAMEGPNSPPIWPKRSRIY